MVLFSSKISGHVSFLLRCMNDGNADLIFQELAKCTMLGTEESILLLQSCLDSLNLHEKDLNYLQLPLLYASIMKLIMNRPNFTTVICESLRMAPISEEFLQKLCSALQLSGAEKIGIGLALSNSEDYNIRLHGKSFCMSQIADLCSSPFEFEKSCLIQEVLLFLKRSEGLSMHVDSFIQMLSLMKLDAEQFILLPLVSDEFHEQNFLRHLDLRNENVEDDFDAILAELEKEISMADVLSEIGYGCTVSVSQCKEILSIFSPLSNATISKIVGTVSRTCTGLDESQNTFATFRAAITGENFVDLPNLSTWNVDVLVDSINQLAPGTDWINVMESLDHEGFYIPNEMAFSFLMSVYKCACKDPFPLHAICGFIWKNVEGQLSFLKYAVSSPVEVFTFVHSDRKLSYNDALLGYTFQPGQINDAWLCLDLLEILCQLSEQGHASFVRNILEGPLSQCSEILLIGMAHVNTSYNLIRNEVAAAVLPQALKNTTGNRLIFNLWHANSEMLLRGVIEAMNLNPEIIYKILDACQELKILSAVMNAIPLYFGIQLAVIASKKEIIDLENWLNNQLVTNADVFYGECLKFVKDFQEGVHIVSANHLHPHSSVLNAFTDACSIILKVLQSHTATVSSSDLTEETEKMYVTNLRADSRAKTDGGPDSSPDNYSEDIEAESNSYFHQMFSGQLSIDEMIQMLTRFKESANKREQLIFDCMIANLFEEYKFFSKYPERQLKLAAVLFGSLIKYQLVTHLTLGIALRAVLDALRKPADSKMFTFGTLALEQFLDRLVEWPQYCNHILQISHLRIAHSNLVTMTELALSKRSGTHNEHDVPNVTADTHQVLIQPTSNVEFSGSTFSLAGTGPFLSELQASSGIQVPQRVPVSFDERRSTVAPSNYLRPVQSSAGLSSPSLSANDVMQSQGGAGISSLTSATTTGLPRNSRAASARFGSALNIETLVAAAERRQTPIEAPASDIQDKISFIINNLSPTNFEAKAKEFSEVLNEQYYPWFAQYIVMKRASIETNFHDVYLKFLEKLNLKHLNQEIVQATYENCKVLLGSELIKSSSEERSLLKNLGSWLGKITIGRNHVLRAREIDLKPLIIEAYERGLMIAILESCSTSIAYRPPNPWTMAVLGLLAEIYAMPNVKMNIKFEIEVLSKHLGVDLKDVTPSSLLKDRVRELEGNPDFSNKDAVITQPSVINEVKPGIVTSLNQVELPVEVAAPLHPSGPPQMMPQYGKSLHSSGTLAEEKKLVSLGFSDQLPAVHGLLQGQLQFPVNQLPVPAANIEQQIVVNEKIQAYGLHLHFQSVLPIAMDRAVKDIVSSIVQRSVSIATQTTRELVLKDYAMEPDETLIKNAAHLMVARLAGSLAHVTCKEPVRSSISNHLRSLLQGLSIISSDLDKAIQMVTYDNLDLGCVLIEQAATEKAVQTIDGEIAQQLSIRRKHRESVGTPFFDSSMYSQNQISTLPEALRPKPGQLSHSQQRVYEDFARFPGQNRSSQSSPAASIGPSSLPGNDSVPSQLFPSSSSVNLSIYPSGILNSGLGAATAVSDVTPDELDPIGVQIPASASSMRNPISDDTHSLESESVASFPPASPRPPEAAIAVKPANVSLAPEKFGSNVSEPLTTGDALEMYQSISEKLEILLSNSADEAEIQGVISEVPAVILRCISRDEAALAVAQRAFKNLYDNAPTNTHIDTHLSMLASVRDVSKLIVKELTNWVIYSEDDRKFNRDIAIGLIQCDLLNLAEYSLHMAKLIDGGRNKVATEFAISLIQALIVQDSRLVTEMHSIVEALAKANTTQSSIIPGSPESLLQLVEIAKNPSNAGALPPVASVKDDNIRTPRDRKDGIPVTSWEDSSVTEFLDTDPAAFHEKVSALFGEWYQICELSGGSDAACARFVLHLQQRGLLKGDDTTDRFFRRIMEVSVSHCLSSEVINSSSSQSYQGQQLSFLAIDIFAKLVFSVLKFSAVEQGSSKLSLLPKVLNVAVKFIQKDAEEKRTSFNPRPYFRLFINWMIDLLTLDPLSEGTNFQVLTALANSFHALQPSKVPGFCFCWLELVSHRRFMPKLLTVNLQKGWPYLQRLLVDLFHFMEPFLRNSELGEPVHLLYRGTLRVLLVLLHDFPEFLCDYHFSFCDVIPPRCVQMRNIILVAFPRNIRFPDPSAPNLKIDLLSEMSQPPRILSEVDAALKAKQMKNDVDEYLKMRQQGSSFLTDLKQKLLLPPNEIVRAGTSYNVPLINSLVLYVGIHAIQQQQARAPSHLQSITNMDSLLGSAALDIFQALITDLDAEGRYLFLNAIANQLRYPNNHTYYFSFVLLYLFFNANQEIIQEQITRVLLERHKVKKPHPWGILVTSFELIKNSTYKLWSKNFIRGVPEVEKMLESIVRSYGGQKATEDTVVS
ncbi:hypothetical protein M569_07155, partial [Genlisea aurea]